MILDDVGRARLERRLEEERVRTIPLRRQSVGDQSAAVRVLVVDDERQNLRVLERILAHAGITDVRSTSRPHDVVGLFAEYRPELVLLDLHMPRRDGFAVLEDLAAHIAGDDFVPVLVLTADPSPVARRRALEMGAKDFVAKPFDGQEIVLRIRNLLETRRLHRALAEQNTLLEQRVRERTRELEAAQMEVLARLAVAAEFRDDDTGQHTRRVGELAARLAVALDLTPAQVNLIRHAAPLHDVGKIAIPDAILRKPDRLTAGELTMIRAHAVVGARILAGGQSALMRMAERIARSHHERWDGTGYPDGLRGEQIPIEARIVAVADVVDALTHTRPYRAAWPLAAVLDFVHRARGTHFDPTVVDALSSDGVVSYLHRSVARSAGDGADDGRGFE